MLLSETLLACIIRIIDKVLRCIHARGETKKYSVTWYWMRAGDISRYSSFIYIYIERERERERQTETERQEDRECSILTKTYNPM